MADIELVIKIPKDTYVHLLNGGNIGASLMIENALKNGTPLPKGHGRLIDADALKGNRQIQIVPCGNGKYVEVMTYYQNDIDVAPTIIEADTAGSGEV